ncbi:enoyl-CoA hydratase/isomerase family protein [Sinimarinibacterium thermocellulolyticum]|uniref:Enoyl-CoA hydratase/isomerase family protein n=1 Tax=Sinimarinibacterium thermocellulolyticum TaxID=3170016 RepID=A0ABV2A819_9GAMM
MHFDDYRNGWRHAVLDRSPEGVLQIRLHSDGGPLWWGGGPHRELPELFAAVAADRDNRVVILTGTGSHFIDYATEAAGLLAREGVPAGLWDRILWEGKRLITQYLDIDVPIIAAVNGPARAHSELAVMADIVLASQTALFKDAPHFENGLVPGDGVQVIWLELLGLNRGRHFLLTGAELDAAEAQRLGVVAEVLPSHELLPRAHALALQLAIRDKHLLRYTRHVCTQRLKRRVLEELELGLALEGLAAAVPRG